MRAAFWLPDISRNGDREEGVACRTYVVDYYQIAYGGTDLDGHVTGHENYQSDTDSDLRADHACGRLVSSFRDRRRSTGRGIRSTDYNAVLSATPVAPEMRFQESSRDPVLAASCFEEEKSMAVFYTSTRDNTIKVTAAEAILQGLSRDGGLFVPETIPALPVSLSELTQMDYRETALMIMREWFSDFSEEELKKCVEGAYDSKFDTELIAPLHETAHAAYLELFHGKTIAFKDMALSILPYLMTCAAAKCGVTDEIVILTATSGDTGKAALAGFADVPGTRIIVFYPKYGVSPIQERQMVTQTGRNVSVVGIRGNFDDAQNGVKAIFSDPELRSRMKESGFRFSSANSINIGRLVPQIVYYVYAYAQMVRQGKLACGESMNVTVPTGNFGNILAAYYAKRMGLPIRKLICASNENRVLTDFFETGTYDRRREFILTTSPSMDILISSNLERLIYAAAQESSDQSSMLMEQLTKEGSYQISGSMKQFMEDFYGGCADMDACAARIRGLFEKEHYLIDPHTAVAACVYDQYRNETDDDTPCVIASTASPYKFTRRVMEALRGKASVRKDTDDLVLADELEKISGVPLPAAVAELKEAPVLHDIVIDSTDMKAQVEKQLGLMSKECR